MFCSDMLTPRAVDLAYGTEHEAAQRAGFATALLNYERLVNDEDAIRAMPRAPLADLPMPIIYRGWMLPAAAYARLAEAVAGGGGELLTAPERYRATHELPGWYHLLADVTPQTVWMPLAPGSAPDVAALLALLAPFGHGPVLLKDFVKSRKDEWLESCFIPSASDTAAVERVRFAPDGATLASADQSGVIRVWALQLDQLLEIATRSATRQLTTQECREYLHLDACPEPG